MMNDVSINDTTKDKHVLQSAPLPPWHSILVVSLLTLISLLCLPNVHDFDKDYVAIERFNHRLFPQYISVNMLGSIRAIFALIIWSTCFYSIFLGPGYTMVVPYLPGSKLVRTTIRLTGFRTMYPFTSWSWILLGFYFTLSSYICFQSASNKYVARNTLRITIALWEVSAPFTLLVSAVVRYVLWPRTLAETGDTSNLRVIKTLIKHNANVAFAVIEISLLSGMPIRIQDLPLAPLVGCLYVLFSWRMVRQWVKPQYGPQFIYFFLDTTLPGYATSIAILGLLFVLIVSYAIFFGIGCILSFLDGANIAINIIFAVAISASVMRFRDK